MSVWMESEWMTQLSWVLLHSAWQFTLIAALVFGVSRILLRHSATGQYCLACFGLLLMTICPVATWHSLTTPGRDIATAQTVKDQPHASRSHRRATSPTVGSTMQPVDGIEATLNGRVPIGSMSFAPLNASRHVLPRIQWIAVAWLIGVTLCFVRPAIGIWGHRKWSRLASNETPELRLGLQRAARRMGVDRFVLLRVTQDRVGPLVVGWIRPMIVVPAAMVSSLSAHELELLLAHELAHVRRQDYLVNLLQVFIETVFFYHPAVWWLSRQVRMAREYCCDEMAATDAQDRLGLGRALLSLEQFRSPNNFALAATDGDLLQRVRRLSTVQGYSMIAVRFRLAMSLIFLGSVTALTSALPAQELQQPMPSDVPANASERRPESNSSDTETVVKPSAEAEQDRGLPHLDDDHVYWDLTLEECVSIALQNARINGRSLSFTTKPQDDSTTDTLQIILHLNEDISIVDFEERIRGLVNAVEIRYWNLQAAYQQASAALSACEHAQSAVDTARKHLSMGTGTRQELAQAEGFHHWCRARFFVSLSGSKLPDKVPNEESTGLHGHEKELRRFMGLAASDGRLIRPTQRPSTLHTPIDWERTAALSLHQTALHVRETRRVEQLKLELEKARRQISPELKAKLEKLEIDSTETSSLAGRMGKIRELEIREDVGGETRRTMSRILRAQHELTHSTALLREVQRRLLHLLSQSITQAETHAQLMRTAAQRVNASKQEFQVRRDEYEKGLTPVNVLLQSQQRLAEAKQRSSQTICEYAKSISHLDMIRGTLLTKYDIELVEAE